MSSTFLSNGAVSAVCFGLSRRNFVINGTNGDLIITSVSTNHSGQFACRVSVATGCNVYSDNATLIVTGDLFVCVCVCVFVCVE